MTILAFVTVLTDYRAHGMEAMNELIDCRKVKAVAPGNEQEFFLMSDSTKNVAKRLKFERQMHKTKNTLHMHIYRKSASLVVNDLWRS